MYFIHLSFLLRDCNEYSANIRAPCADTGAIYLAFTHYTNLEAFNVHKLVVSAEVETSSLYTLAANAELLDKVEVRLTVFCSDVLQVTLTLANKLD